MLKGNSSSNPISICVPIKSELVFYWKDAITDAEAVLAINKMINGIGGGGIFMTKNATQEEVEDIAENMTKKFTVTHPMIGGAKCGIRFDPNDHRAKDVIRRMITHFKPLLTSVWITAGDLNTDDSYIEKCVQEECGLVTCQATLGRKIAEARQEEDLSCQLRDLISQPATEFFPMIEAAVGYGVMTAVQFFIEKKRLLVPTRMEPFRVMIQGFGAVGSSLAYYLEKYKIAKVVGIADKDGYIYASEGLPIQALLSMRKTRKLSLLKQEAKEGLIAECSKNFFCNLDDQKIFDVKEDRNPSWSNQEYLEKFLTHPADIFCPCATRYCVTKEVSQRLVDSGYQAVISGANNPFGESDGKTENTDQSVRKFLEANQVCVVPDYVANSGTAQLFHCGLSVKFDWSDPDLSEKVLTASSNPIRSFLQDAYQMISHKENPLMYLTAACLQLTSKRLNHPIPLHQPTSSSHDMKTKSQQWVRSRYALPPPLKSLPLEERYKKVISIGGCIKNCVQPEELYELLKNCPNPVAYDGFECSGRIHISGALLKMINVNKLTDAGFTFLFWIADWFSALNLKMGGDMAKIRILGEYFIEVWRASGMNMDRVRFLWASEEINQYSNEYFTLLIEFASHFSLKRVERCCTIMGKKDLEALQSSQILYPLMQGVDPYFLGTNVNQLGVDQLKCNMLGRDFASFKKLTPPIILSHPMLPGLKKGQGKMSKSDPDNALFVEDSEKEIIRKIKGAYCEAKEIKENPCLAYMKHIVCELIPEIKLDHVTYTSYDALENAFEQGKIHPLQLKECLAQCLNTLLEPIRNHFRTNQKAKELLEQVRMITQT